MCGFLSIYLKNNNFLNKIDLIKNDFKDFKFRGPDNSNFEEFIVNNNKLIFAHHRLSILDLDERSNQPLNSLDNRYKLIFNGEIYNHLELRNEINLKYKINWRGHSDTETLLNLLIHFPTKYVLDKLIGMFSFMFYDFKANNLVISRDRAGEKPLYFSFNQNFFGCSSDIRSFKNLIDFKNSINLSAFNKYMQYNYVPHPFSIINEVYKLPPGSFVNINLNKIKFDKYSTFESLIDTNFFNLDYYWKIENRLNDHSSANDINYYKNTLDKHIENSVKAQLISDVPVGAFLSGGNDSSLIVANMQKFQNTNTFTIGFEESDHDESIDAKEISKYLGTKHTEIICSQKEARDIIPNLKDAFSEPFADSSQIPTMLVSKLASQHVKVALSGDGGDEIFGGYNRYLIAKKFWKYIKFLNFGGNVITKKIIEHFPEQFINFFLQKHFSSYSSKSNSMRIKNIKQKVKYITNEKQFYESLINQYYNHNISSESNLIIDDLTYKDYGRNFIHSMMISDFRTYLSDDILCKVDRSSMFYSLELRSPYLDKNLIEFAINIPTKYQFKNNNSKYLIKSILEKYLPKHLIYKKKKGFSVPISDWIKNELKPWADDLLSKNTIESHNLISYSFVKDIKEKHYENIENNEHKLWSIIQFNNWFKYL